MGERECARDIIGAVMQYPEASKLVMQLELLDLTFDIEDPMAGKIDTAKIYKKEET